MKERWQKNVGVRIVQVVSLTLCCCRSSQSGKGRRHSRISKSRGEDWVAWGHLLLASKQNWAQSHKSQPEFSRQTLYTMEVREITHTNAHAHAHDSLSLTHVWSELMPLARSFLQRLGCSWQRTPSWSPPISRYPGPAPNPKHEPPSSPSVHLHSLGLISPLPRVGLDPSQRNCRVLAG